MSTSSGILYVVATPIGNLNDMSARAISVLREVDQIAAEDTRHSGQLLKHLSIKTPLISLHEHNERQRAKQLIEALQQGKNIALISDAGTPLISDPGQLLIQEAHAHQIKVSPVPGACALIAALSVAGIPTNHFIFEGFLPAKTAERQRYLESVCEENRTLVFYEAPHRILKTVTDLLSIFGENRYVVLARELTKTFETIYGAPLSELLPWLQTHSQQQKGEFVIVVQGAEKNPAQLLNAETIRILKILLQELPVKQAVALAMQITGAARNVLYEWAQEHR